MAQNGCVSRIYKCTVAYSTLRKDSFSTCGDHTASRALTIARLASTVICATIGTYQAR